MKGSVATLGTLVLGLAIANSDLQGQEPRSSGRPDGHAPLGVMGDHVHSVGEVMFSYRYMRMHMEGNRNGTDPTRRPRAHPTR